MRYEMRYEIRKLNDPGENMFFEKKLNSYFTSFFTVLLCILSYYTTLFIVRGGVLKSLSLNLIHYTFIFAFFNLFIFLAFINFD
jgi:hypothetical protein